MYQSLLTRSSLYRVLLKLEDEMAAAAKALGCLFCDGKLHCAYYRRKPRGAPPEVEGDPAYRQRRSFCCAVEGCRRRRTPPSVLFLGRKVYLGAVVTLVSVLRHGPSPTRLSRLSSYCDAPIRMGNGVLISEAYHCPSSPAGGGTNSGSVTFIVMLCSGGDSARVTGSQYAGRSSPARSM